ncbi:hypothetical protein ACJJTC_000053 [Scirpophaga incertulas]
MKEVKGKLIELEKNERGNACGNECEGNKKKVTEMMSERESMKEKMEIKYCTETEAKCSHCGGLHRQDQCEEKVKGTIPVCVNCASEKHSDVGHNAFSASCPIRRKWDSIARARVAYN